jgi:tRNA dimethylallyltransferase
VAHRGRPHKGQQRELGVADPRENYSVARYADDAAKCVDDILSRGKQPVIVGGTGLYLNALLAGHGFAGGDKDGRYRAELESRWDKEGGEAMFADASTPRPPEISI